MATLTSRIVSTSQVYKHNSREKPKTNTTIYTRRIVLGPRMRQALEYLLSKYKTSEIAFEPKDLEAGLGISRKAAYSLIQRLMKIEVDGVKLVRKVRRKINENGRIKEIEFYVLNRDLASILLLSRKPKTATHNSVSAVFGRGRFNVLRVHVVSPRYRSPNEVFAILYLLYLALRQSVFDFEQWLLEHGYSRSSIRRIKRMVSWLFSEFYSHVYDERVGDHGNYEVGLDIFSLFGLDKLFVKIYTATEKDAKKRPLKPLSLSLDI